MDKSTKVAEGAWINTYFFKMDHKNGNFHVPLHIDSRKYFGLFWKGIYEVLTVLPFWKGIDCFSRLHYNGTVKLG